MAFMSMKKSNKYSLPILASAILFGCGMSGASFEPDGVELNNKDKLGKADVSTDSEMAQRRKIFDRTEAALSASDFAALNKMADEYRSRRALTPSGTWKISSFYEMLDYKLANRKVLEGCVNRAGQNILDRWAQFSPNEPTVHIMQSRIRRGMAWCIRGNAYSSQVASKDMAEFRDMMDRTFEDLDAAKELASNDPEYYVEMIHLYPNMGASKADFMDLLNEAVG